MTIEEADKFSWRRIRTWLESTVAEQPLLLHGSSEHLLEAQSRKIAQALVCTDKVEQRPCGQCKQCELAGQGQHQNIVTAELDNGRVKIKEARRVKEWLGLASWNGKRLVVIPQAETLELEAANMLLKALEEPAQDTRFLFWTARWRTLLPTIRSRCASLRLPGLAAEREPAPDWMTLPGLARMGVFQKRDALTAAELTAVREFLEEKLRQDGPTAAVKQGFGRMRDYYYMLAHNGNEKMARDLLIGGLPE